MMPEAIEQKIEELYKKLHLLKARREELNKEAQTWAEKRNRIHEEIRNLRAQIKSLKQTRDEMNEEVKRLKSLREDGLKKRKAIIEEIEKLGKEKARMSAEKPPRSRSHLESEIERIEWKIQTEPLPLNVERALIDQLRDLEIQREFYRRIESINNKIASLRKEAKELKAYTLAYSSRISKTAARSQEYHAKMLKKTEAMRDLKVKADEMHQRYVEKREKAKTISLEIKKTLDEIRSIQDLIKKREEEEQKQKQADLQKQTEKKALEKLRRGEKLTFDEFKILLEKGKNLADFPGDM